MQLNSIRNISPQQFSKEFKKTLEVESKFSYQQPDASSMGYVMC